jgi:hypothetical protein
MHWLEGCGLHDPYGHDNRDSNLKMHWCSISSQHDRVRCINVVCVGSGYHKKRLISKTAWKGLGTS